MKLWTGQTVSELGSRITRDGVPLAAAMVLGAGPFQMGILNAANGVGVLLPGLYAGLWVDRLRRLPIMIWADAPCGKDLSAFLMNPEVARRTSTGGM